MLTELHQTCFFECVNLFLRCFTISASVRQITIMIKTVLLIFEKEKGMVLFLSKVNKKKSDQCLLYFVKPLCHG